MVSLALTLYNCEIMLEKQQLPSEATIFLSSPNEARFRSNASVLMDFSASLFRISAHSVVAHLNKKTAFVDYGKSFSD
jgi:hypothetical protein